MLTSKGLIEKLFDKFRDYPDGKGFIMSEGKMIIASFTVAPRQHPDSQKRENSKTKPGVEHIFGIMVQNIACPDPSVNGLSVKSIGMERASGIILLVHLTYNLYRNEQVIRLNILNII